MLNDFVKLNRIVINGEEYFSLPELMIVIGNNPLDDYIREGIDKIPYKYITEFGTTTVVLCRYIIDIIFG